MSLLKANAVQLGQSLTASQNFTWYQPASPDGTVRLGNGNSGSVTDLVTLTSAGNLGIGTSSPAQVLDVQKAQAWVTATSTTGTNSSVFKTANTGGSSYFGRESSAGTVFGGGAYATVVYGSGAYPMSFFTNDTKQMTLDSSGNLGLGVTPSGWSSTYKALDLNTYGAIASNAGSVSIWANGYFNGSNSIYKNSNYALLYNQIATTGQHAWYTAPSGTAGNAISFTQAMTLDANGNLLVGVTSYNAGVNANFHLFGANNGSWYAGHASGTASGVTYADFRYNGATIGTISQNGTTGVLYNITSDQRLKDDLGVADDTSVIDNTIIHDFEWKADGSLDRGVFAQEAQKVKPSAVTPGQSDELNEEGRPVHPWGVDYSKYVPDLIVYCQQLRKELNELKQKVNA